MRRILITLLGWILVGVGSGCVRESQPKADLSPLTGAGVCIAEVTGAEVTIVNLDGQSRRLRLPLSSEWRLSSVGRIAPDGSYIVVLGQHRGDTAETLLGFDTAGVQLWQVPSPVSDVPAVSPDAKRLAFRSNNQLHLYDIPTQKLTTVPVNANHPAWAPTGDRLAYDHDGYTYVVALSTGSTSKISKGTEPSWTSDGKSIAVLADGERVELVSVQSGEHQPLVSGTLVTVPRWLPGTDWFLYTRAGGASTSFWKNSADAQQVIVKSGGSDAEAAVTTFFKADPGDFTWVRQPRLCTRS